MSVNTGALEGAVGEVQQFQTDQAFRQDGSRTDARPPAAGQGALLVEAGDISLAMRQFYQVPKKSLS